MLNQGVAGNTWFTGQPIFDLEYADDTLITSLPTPQLQNDLRVIESEATLYGMFLSNTKTELLNHPDHPAAPLFFKDGSRVRAAEQVKHLSSQASWINPLQTAFYHRASIAESSYKKNRLVWNSSLRTFQSTFRSTLMYGLHAVPLITPQLNRIDVFLLQVLRRVIGIKVSFYSRVPNRSVWRQAG